MNTELHPIIFSNQEYDIEEEERKEADRKYDEAIIFINRSSPHFPRELFVDFLLVGMVVSICIFIFNIFYLGIIKSFVLSVIVMVLFGIVGCCVDVRRKKDYDSKSNQIMRDIDSIGKKYEEECQTINEKHKKIRKRYEEEFEKNLQNLTRELVNSNNIKRIASWLEVCFSNNIDFADRSEHIERISATLIFEVFKDYVSCESDRFVFERMGCPLLKNQLEQAAMSKAIALEVQDCMRKKYKRDRTGNVSSITFDSTVSNPLSIKTTLLYEAVNGRYKGV